MTSIRARLVVGFVVLLAADLAGYGVLFHTVVHRWLAPDALAMAKDKAVRLGRWVKPERVAYDESLYANVRNEAQGYYWAVMDAAGRPVQRSRALPEFFPLPATAQEERYAEQEPYAETRQDTNGALYAVAWYPVFSITPERRTQITGWTEAVVPLQPFLERQARLGRWLLAAGLVALLTFSALAFHLCGLWLRPWRVTAEAARRLAASDLAERRLPAVADDADLAGVVQAFNALLERLKAAHSRQQQFVADAAHELRTPLSALRAEIEVALRRQRSGGEYEQTLQLNRLELERLGALVENLLALAQLDSHESRSARSSFNLAVVCRDVAEQLASRAGAQGLHLTLAVPDELTLTGDAPALERALRNLVENAIKHTPSGEEIIICLESDAAEIRVAVRDHGVGIAPEHLPRIFDRFYRVDTARNRAVGGAGLGLAIVVAIAEAHGGSVTVESELGKGSVFTIRLPRGKVEALE
jgi:heavy metal sensor kinase